MSETNSLNPPDQATDEERPRNADDMPVADAAGHALLECVGAGGMGEVYRCGDDVLQRDLAIKILKAELKGDAAAEQRFLREARLTGSLQHPGIVPVHHLGRIADGRPCYTMKLVRGRTLADLLRDEPAGPERLPRLLAIIEKVCQAMAFAHSKGILHRDLKPSNVMVGEFGEVQVMDWGLAKQLSRTEPALPAGEATEEVETVGRVEEAAGLSRAGAALGTPAYMPPEQAAGDWDIVDERADVFALGAILCEVLTGRPPYSSANRDDLLRRARRGDVAEALERLRQCGADATLTELCRTCLSPDRELRPRDAGAVAMLVSAYQSEVQERLRQAEWERAQVEVREREERKRRRWAIAFGVMLLAVAALSTWLALRATKAETKAVASEAMAQNRLEQIEKANEVLASIFYDLDPIAEEKGGPSLRLQMSQHIQQAAAQLDEVAIGDPLTVARLRYTLGQSLNNLGRVREAIGLLKQAYQIQERELGPDHPQTLDSMHQLALAYHGDGKPEKGIELLAQCLERRKATLGPRHPDTLIILNYLAGLYLATHQFDKVEPFLEELEKYASLEVLEDLVMAYFLTDQTERAIPLAERALEMRRAKSGLDDPKTLHTMHDLASAYWKSGQENKAIPMYEHILQKQQEKLPADHRDTLVTMENLGLAYLKSGQIEKGLALLEKGWQKWNVKIGPGNPGSLDFRMNLVCANQMARKFDRADTLLRDELEIQRKKGRPGSDATLFVEANLGLNLLRQQRYTEAETLLRACLKASESKRPNGWGTFHMRSLLGDALMGQKKYPEAEPLLLQGYEGMKQREATIPREGTAYLTEALERLVQLYEATNKMDEAAKRRKQVDDRKAAQKKPKP